MVRRRNLVERRMNMREIEQLMREVKQLDEIEKYGKLFIGRKEWIKMLNGEKIPASARCKAKCYDCM